MVASPVAKSKEWLSSARCRTRGIDVPRERFQAGSSAPGHEHPERAAEGQNFLKRSHRIARLLFILSLASVLLLVSCGGGGGFARGLIRWGSGWSPAAASDGVVYVGTRQGEVLALDAQGALEARTDEKGRVHLDEILLWRFAGAGDRRLGGVFGKPAVGNEFIYVADGGDRQGKGGMIYALRKDRGVGSETRLETDEWVRRVDRGIVGGPALAEREGLVLVGSDDGNLYFLWTTGDDAGKIAWSFHTEGQIWSGPVIDDGVVYFGSMDRYIYAISLEMVSKLLHDLQEINRDNRTKRQLQQQLEEDTLLWKYKTGGAVVSTPLVMDGMVIVGSFDKKLYALDAKSGEWVWDFKGNGWFWAGPVTDGQHIFAPSMDQKVYALDNSGNLIWPLPGDPDAFKAESPIVSTPVVVGDSLVVATDNGRLHLLEASSGIELEFYRELGGRVKAPLSRDGDLLVVGVEDSTVRGVNVKQWREVWRVSTK